MKTIKTSEYIVTFDNSEEVRQALFNKLLDFFVKHESFSGESICQSDSPQIEAPELLAEIADKIFKFKVEWLL